MEKKKKRKGKTLRLGGKGRNFGPMLKRYANGGGGSIPRKKKLRTSTLTRLRKRKGEEKTALPAKPNVL